MSSIGFNARCPIVGAHADHRTTDFFFPRTQSLEIRNLPWERRIKPLIPVQRVALQAFVVLAAAVLTFSIV
jgi:hypothetical protein